MISREIAVIVNNDNKDVSVIETIDAIKNAGFKNVFYNGTITTGIPRKKNN